MRILALVLCAATAAAAADKPVPMLAVLNFRNKLQGADKDNIDTDYLADSVRSAALKALPGGVHVMTRENMLVMLKNVGKTLEQCEGECEVDTGRNVGADLVVSGDVLRFGTSYKLVLRMHDTHDAQLVSGTEATGTTLDELDRATKAAVRELLGPLIDKAAAEKEAADRAVAEKPAIQAAPQVAAPAPAPARKTSLPDLYLGGAYDPNHKTLGYEAGLEVRLGAGFFANANAVIGPHVGGRLGVYRWLGGGLSIGLRGLVEPLPDGVAFGGGLALRFSTHILADWLSIVATGAAEAYKTHTETVFAPLFSAGLQLEL